MSDGVRDDSWVDPHPGAAPALVAALRAALARYELEGSGAALDRGFAAAAEAVAELRGERAGEPPDVDEVQALLTRLPEFEQVVSAVVAELERSAEDAVARLWSWCGLRTAPPEWADGERSRARVLVACACASPDGRAPDWLRPRLVKLAAGWWASVLADELRGASEAVWRQALGDRYEPVRHRCAPRTRSRIGKLSELLATDPEAVAMLRGRVGRWLSEGGELERLPSALEAAFVETRAPEGLA